MGTAILDGMLKNSDITNKNLFIIEPNLKQKLNLEKKQLKVFNNLSEVNISKTKINAILLAVKPQVVKNVILELKNIMSNSIFIISIVAGKNIRFYKNILGNQTSVIRVMPNIPASYSKGVTAIYPCNKTKIINLNLTKKLFLSVGKIIILKSESKMDIVTAISGSGPAYVFLFIESMIKSAIRAGLDKKTANLLVIETLLGASYLASISEKSPEVLRKDVTSPGGTTEAALKVLNNKNSLYNIINKAIMSAIKKSIKLSS